MLSFGLVLVLAEAVSGLESEIPDQHCKFCFPVVLPDCIRHSTSFNNLPFFLAYLGHITLRDQQN